MPEEKTTGPLYLDDLQVGTRFESEAYSLDSDQIKAFAAQFDPQPFHLDESAAAESFFGELVASGWHTACLTMRLIVGSVPLAGGVIGAGGEVSWQRATRPGDTLRVLSEIIDIATSRSRPGRGMISLRSETLNQHGEPVQVMTAKLIVPRRPAA